MDRTFVFLTRRLWRAVVQNPVLSHCPTMELAVIGPCIEVGSLSPENALGKVHDHVDIAVIILTYNEELNLPAALDSVKGWASEVFVVDSFSTDRTVEIALERVEDGVQVVQHDFSDYSEQWNWALKRLPIKSTWTLKLDADERVTEDFKRKVLDLLARVTADVEGVCFKRTLFFSGKPMRWAGHSKTYLMRLWRTGKAVFENRAVNEHALVQGNIETIRASIEHHQFKSIADWISKHNRYSSLEAISFARGNLTGGVKPKLFGMPAERRMWLRRAYRVFPFRVVLYFFYRYVWQLGFLDGKRGFRYAFLHASYRYWTELKIIEQQITCCEPEVEWPQRGTPHPVVRESKIQHTVDGHGKNRAA